MTFGRVRESGAFNACLSLTPSLLILLLLVIALKGYLTCYVIRDTRYCRQVDFGDVTRGRFVPFWLFFSLLSGYSAWVAGANSHCPFLLYITRKGWKLLPPWLLLFFLKFASFLASFASKPGHQLFEIAVFVDGMVAGPRAATLVTHQARGNGGARLSSRDCDLASIWHYFFLYYFCPLYCYYYYYYCCYYPSPFLACSGMALWFGGLLGLYLTSCWRCSGAILRRPSSVRRSSVRPPSPAWLPTSQSTTAVLVLASKSFGAPGMGRWMRMDGWMDGLMDGLYTQLKIPSTTQ